MEDIQIKFSLIWAALMLTYLLGDVLRIFSGNFVPGEIMGAKISQLQWLGIAALMVIPIVMVVLSMILPHPINRWANLIVAVFFFIFNAIGLPSYSSAYDKFLIIISLALNGMTIRCAWLWV